MPLALALHERDALGLDSVGDDHGWAALFRLGAVDGARDFLHVVAVDGLGEEAEALKLGLEIAHIQNLAYAPIQLNLVAVQDDDEIVQLVGAGVHQRLPDLPLLNLAVAQHGVHCDMLAEHFCTLCHADRRGEPLPQRSRRHVHARHVVHFRVARQISVNLPELAQPFERHIPPHRQRRI